MPPDRHLLVDAYNVIHAWPELRTALADHGPDAARALLATALRPIHDAEGWRVTIVFDGKGDAITVERPGTELTFSYVFGPSGLSADGVIEQLVANANLDPDLDRRPGRGKKEEPAEIVVATRDNLLGESARASGARLLTPELLRDWADRAASQQTRDLLTRQKRGHSTWKSATSLGDKLPKLPKA
jgi:predicted RNA-binding protein with PIN domain